MATEPLDLGPRLRQIRSQAGLSQADVARRMGLGADRHSVIARLEIGKVKDPCLKTVVYFLRACDAKVSDFFRSIALSSLYEPDLSLVDKAQLPATRMQRLKARIRSQSLKFDIKTRRRLRKGRPFAPGLQRRMARGLGRYRAVAELVQETVLEVMRREPVKTVDYPKYHAFARHVLSLLWHEAETQAGRQRLARPRMPEGVAGKLAAEQGRWREQGLDLRLVAKVQTAVFAQFRRILPWLPAKAN